MISNLVDFHCHLDLYRNHAAAVAESERLKIFTLAVTTTPRAWPRNQELAAPTKYVRAALGLHPQLVKERAHELPIWREYLARARYVGEVGLDAGPAFYASFESQRKVFETVLRDCADQGGKILTIHSVRAAKVVIDMIEALLPPTRGVPVLHWFTGSKSDAARAAKLGMYFSINREMLRNERHRSTVMSLPLDRLLTETDGPFAKIDGRDARSGDVAMTVEELARLRSMPTAELTGVIAANLKRLTTT
ncbi:Qat anti-phage system TatD family nuclease QatD [Bradyrhizobium arachidis]|uniref:TatD family deoxyribonuclease n=1 Tax=Bradyrhizobium arachidis TaxID=858423 RepID=A0AAE7NXW8_9BRAD|nr:Qat anti-phage system TatD family nuclease QatD [Bradyrhizobium arachidis]QOZ73842.1 TatD family deoxyribonuclease [Bradyrhizobium arachidis]SFV14479.1 TatD DNase family protein [Bradyrhizobium arachidis]